MFCTCNSLQTLHLGSFKTENVKYMDGMFNACNELRTIYIGSGWSIKNVLSSKSMFYNCYNLVGGNGTVYDSNRTDATYARVDATGIPGYFTDIEKIGIEMLESDRQEFNSSWFSLDGTRFENKPTKQGIYIHQGRKIILRTE